MSFQRSTGALRETTATESSRRKALRLFVVAVVAVAVPGCGPVSVDPFEKLPKSVGGEVLQYHVSQGADSEPWAKEVLESTGLPESALSSATAFTFPDDNEYQSYIVRVEGADGWALVRPLIDSFGIFENVRKENMAGETVMRYDLRDGPVPDPDVSFAYAFDDLAIAVLARRPQEAIEALNAMP